MLEDIREDEVPHMSQQLQAERMRVLRQTLREGIYVSL